jgi:hypothetical protein
MKAVNGGLHHQPQIVLARIFRLPVGIVKTRPEYENTVGMRPQSWLPKLLFRARCSAGRYSVDVDRRSIQE